MSAEGMGIVLGFSTLLLAMIGQAAVFWYKNGRSDEKLDNVVAMVNSMEKDNKTGHEKIFDCQKETDVKVGKIEQHLQSMNGSMRAHADRLLELEKDSHKEH